MSRQTGFNTNINHKNKLYHIQTEINSVKEEKTINTLIYLDGQICFSEKNKINSRILQSNELILEEVKSQHKDVIKKLISNEILSDKNANSIDFETLYLKESPFPLKTTETSIKEKIRKLILS